MNQSPANDKSHGATRPYRVVQWATGNIGTHAMRAVIQHPNMELVGLHVHSESKVGQDAGELCGLGKIGVSATRDIKQILKLDADCVLYMPQGCNFDEICQLLGAGLNVVTTRGEFQNPAGLDPAVRAQVEDACRRGNTSIHATGSSPGFITEALPLVLTSIQRRLNHLSIHEYADLGPRNSPEMLFGVMGFGAPAVPEANAGRAYYLRQAFGPSLQLLADAVGLPLDSVEAISETAAARNKTRIAAGTVEAGTVAAQRTTITGIRKGKPLISFSANWYCTTDIDADWPLRGDGWDVNVDGDAPMDVRISFPVPPERWAATSPGLTAHRAVNAIPYICAAPAGIRTTVDLPQIIPDLRERGV